MAGVEVPVVPAACCGQPLQVSPHQVHTYRQDVHFEHVHRGITHFVVCCVHQDFIKDLEQAWGKGDILEHQALPVVHPQRLLLLLCAADVGVWAQQDVLQLRLLLIDLLNGLASMYIVCCTGGQWA